MAATITYTTNPPLIDTAKATQTTWGTIALSGDYTEGGDTLNFTTHAVGVQNPIVSNQRPISVRFWEEPASGTVPTALVFSYRNVAAKPTAANGVVQIQGSGTMAAGVPTAGDELAAAAYPAILTGTVLKFEAVFPLGR
jgi:hypothetical protein